MITKVNTSTEAVAESSGASYISKSGIYDVTIDFASIDVAASGAERVNFNITWNGNKQTIWGPWVQGKDGQPLEGGLKLVQKLASIAGLETGDELTLDEETHNVGKNNEEKTFTVITDFSELDVKMRLQEVYSEYKDEIRKEMSPKSFFRMSDGASAEEIVKGTEPGKRLALETEKYASNITYNDGLTPEAVQEWKDSKANGGKSSAPKAKKVAPSKPAGSLF